MQKKKLRDFVLDNSTRAWIAGENGSFSYSDGDAVENRLYEIVRTSTNVDTFSPELVGQICDWPSEYHFSPRRANILRILQNLDKTTKVLELGCGCGAITKAFAEKGCHVDAVEGSFRRASVAAERVREHDQVRVHVANFQDVEFEPIYDLVTLIGVLEYSPVYLDSPDPFHAALEMAASALKPGGTLVVAIENKLGLKYFAGITEDHFSIAYYGIEGRYGKRQITTYGKKQLAAKLTQAGFQKIDFYYPFPDYKLPEVVLSERALQTPDFNAADLVSNLENRDYSEKGHANFRVDLAWGSVADEGLLGELSNSFLVLASRAQQTELIDHNIIAQKYTDNRIPDFNCVTNFITRESSILVTKEHLTPAAQSSAQLLQHSTHTENYVPGQNVLVSMQKSLACNDETAFTVLLRGWLDALRSADRNGTLDASWFDACPANFILGTDAAMHLIDCEWQAKFEIDLDLLIFRGLRSLATLPIISKNIPGATVSDKIAHLCALANIDFSAAAAQAATNLDVSLWSDIYAIGRWNVGRYRHQRPERICAIVVHLYYVEMWKDISKKIENIPAPVDIFITAPIENKTAIELLDTKGAQIFYFENRGRDVRPFLKLLQSGALDKYKLVCKIHTKKSPHIADGNEWRERIFDGLLGSTTTVKRFFSAFEKYSDIGLLTYSGGLSNIRQSVMSNAVWLERLSSDLSVDWNAYHYLFPVGTMFWFRPEAIKNAAALADYTFEDEAGQVDGCLHHAIERFLPLASIKNSYRTVSINGPEIQNPIPIQIYNTKTYQSWLAARQLKPAELESLADAPFAELSFTIIINAIDAQPEQLAATLDSFVAQQHTTIQLLVVSALPSPIDDTGVVLWLQTPALSAQILLKIANDSPASWLCLVHAGDLVTKSGLLLLARHLHASAHAGLAYMDEDALDATGEISNPIFKPDFDLDLLRSTHYTGRFLFMRGEEFSALGGLDPTLENAAFLDYVFRFCERFGKHAITHLPEIIFHARYASDLNTDIEMYRETLAAHLQRSQVQASIADGLLPSSFRVLYSHEHKPLISIIIPTKNQQTMLSRCIETLTEKTTYPHYEILIVDNESMEPDAKAYLESLSDLNLPQLRVIHFNKPFNFSAMNNLAAKEARGEYLVLLNNDTAIIKGDWLESLLNHAQRPDTGIVGAKLLYPDGTIQHAGVVLGLRGPADHPFLNQPLNAPGYAGRLQMDQQYSAVTAACLMIRKSVYMQVGGMDEEAFKVSYNDIDLCLKVRESGLSVIWTPYAFVMHVGSVSQNTEDKTKLEAKTARFEAEKQAMYQKWMATLKNDPYYNRNFCLSGPGFELETNEIFRPSLPGQKKLLAHCADFCGSGLYRIVAPATELLKDINITGACSLRYFDPVEASRIDPDTIVLQRQTSDEQLRRMMNYRKHTRAKLIFELDDYLPNLPIASSHKASFPKDITRRLRQAIEICDRVVVSTQTLKGALSQYHSAIEVLPNYLPSSLWTGLPARNQPEPGRKPRVGWAGGVSHAGDLRLIADVVRALSDRVDWVFLGMQPTGVESCIKEFYPAVSIGEYPEKLASLDLDLALAPLEDNLFNECKSNLRLLEYGICGYPVLASDSPAYRGILPVTLVRNRFKDWVSAIDEKLADRLALWQEGVTLQSAVRDSWMLEGSNLLRWRDGWLLTPDSAKD